MKPGMKLSMLLVTAILFWGGLQCCPKRFIGTMNMRLL